MRRSFSLAWLLIIVLSALPLASIVAPAAIPSAAAATPDDEIVLLDSTGRVRVVDPRAENAQTINWQSPETGWTQVVLLDVNGDGDKEIVAMRANLIQAYDPVVASGATPAGFQLTPPTGQSWLKLAGGDVDNDNRDELVVTSSQSSPNAERLFVYKTNATGTGATELRSIAYGSSLRQLTVSDVNGDNIDDIIWIRDSSNLLHIENGQTGAPLHELTYNWPWAAVAAGNLSSAYAGNELIISRNLLDPNNVVGNHLVLRYEQGQSNMATLVKSFYYPIFTEFGVGDLNGDGDAEVAMLRDPVDPRVTVLVLNPAGNAMRAFEQAIGRQWRRVAVGDMNGDGKGEIVVLSATEYRIYTQPDVSDAFDTTAGSFLTSALAVGNLDAPVTVTPVLNVSPDSLTFNVGPSGVAPAQQLSITNSGPGGAFNWTATVTAGATWLIAQPNSGSTPGTVNVTVNAAGLSSGTYQGTIRVTAQGNAQGSPKDIPVTLVVSAQSLSVSPISLVFTAQSGGSNPAPQSVAVTNAGGGQAFNWTAQKVAGGNWFTINPTNGTTPSSFNVSVNLAGLAPGSYDGTIQVNAPGIANSPQTVQVRLTINAPKLVVAPKSARLIVRQGDTNAPPVAISITQEGGGSAINWVAGAIPAGNWPALAEQLNSGEASLVYQDGVLALSSAQGIAALPVYNWLTLNPSSGTTPSTMNIRVDQSAPPGLYHATVVVDGGPHTADRFQGIDVTVMIYTHRSYLPTLTKVD